MEKILSNYRIWLQFVHQFSFMIANKADMFPEKYVLERIRIENNPLLSRYSLEGNRRIKIKPTFSLTD